MNYNEKLEHVSKDNNLYTLVPMHTNVNTNTFRMAKFDPNRIEVTYKYLRVDVYKAENKDKKTMDLVIQEWEDFVKENGGV